MGNYIRQRNPNPGEDIMGLQNFGYVLYPDAKTELEIPYVNNRFRLGSDKSEKSTKFGLTPQQQKEFEDYFGVTFDSPEGKEFLSDYRIVIDHLTTPVDTSNMIHKFNKTILDANDGMGLVNMGVEEEAKRYPFVFVDDQKEEKEVVTRKMTKNAAIAEFTNLSIKNKPRMMLITKYLFDLNADFTEETAYNRLDEFITKSPANAETFLKALDLNQDWVETTVLVKDCMNAGFIRRGADQFYSNHASGVKLGRTIEEIVKFLLNPDNQDQLGVGAKTDQPYSLRTQLKNKIN